MMASAVAANLALGLEVDHAVRAAKAYIDWRFTVATPFVDVALRLV